MPDIYKIILEDGQQYAWHGKLSQLQKTYPGARVTGVLVMDNLGQGTWHTYDGPDAGPPDFDAMTTAQLKEVLANRGKSMPQNAKKEDLVAEAKKSHVMGNVVDSGPPPIEEKPGKGPHKPDVVMDDHGQPVNVGAPGPGAPAAES